MAKMSWYKKSNEIDSFKERSRINKRIKLLVDFVEQLYAINKNLSLNPIEAKRALETISKDKIFTSFPDVETRFNTIDFKILDNPDRATDIIEEIVTVLMGKIDALKQDLNKFNNKTLPDKLKNMWQ